MPKSTATAKDTRAVRVIGAILVLGLCVGYGGFHAARRAEASRVQVAKKRAALEVDIHRLKEITAANSRQLGESKALRRKSPWSVTAEEHSPPNGQKRRPWTVDEFRMGSAVYRARLARTYGALYQSLGLAPVQNEAFEASLTLHEQTMVDLTEVAAADGLDESGPEIAALMKQANEELRAEQTALLGDAGYRQLQEFNRVVPLRGFLDDVAAHTGFLPEPLTETQAQQLAVILQNASSSYQNGGPANPATIDWSAVPAQAQGFLSANQLQGLKGSIDQIKLNLFRSQFFQERGLK